MNDKLSIDELRRLCSEGKVQLTLHVLKRMRERNIYPHDISSCIAKGEIIEDYPDDTPYPSCLVYANIDEKPIHTVVGYSSERIYIVTAYFPSSNEWQPDMKTRRE